MTLFFQNRELLQNFRFGHTDTLTRVYRHYVNDVKLFFRNGFYDTASQTRVVGFRNLEIQKELVQEAFIKAFAQNARESYDGLRPYKTYLLTIAKNCAIDYARTHAKDALSYATIMEGDLSGGIGDKTGETSNIAVEETLYWKNCAATTVSFVQTLASDLQTFVHLRYNQEMPQRNIAKQMNITRSKVRSYEKKIVKGLKDHLKKQGLTQ